MGRIPATSSARRGSTVTRAQSQRAAAWTRIRLPPVRLDQGDRRSGRRMAITFPVRRRRRRCRRPVPRWPGRRARAGDVPRRGGDSPPPPGDGREIDPLIPAVELIEVRTSFGSASMPVTIAGHRRRSPRPALRDCPVSPGMPSCPTLQDDLGGADGPPNRAPDAALASHRHLLRRDGNLIAAGSSAPTAGPVRRRSWSRRQRRRPRSAPQAQGVLTAATAAEPAAFQGIVCARDARSGTSGSNRGSAPSHTSATLDDGAVTPSLAVSRPSAYS